MRPVCTGEGEEVVLPGVPALPNSPPHPVPPPRWGEGIDCVWGAKGLVGLSTAQGERNHGKRFSCVKDVAGFLPLPWRATRAGERGKRLCCRAFPHCRTAPSLYPSPLSRGEGIKGIKREQGLHVDALERAGVTHVSRLRRRIPAGCLRVGCGMVGECIGGEDSIAGRPRRRRQAPRTLALSRQGRRDQRRKPGTWFTHRRLGEGRGDACVAPTTEDSRRVPSCGVWDGW